MHNKRLRMICLAPMIVNLCGYGATNPAAPIQETGLVGYWKLRGDCRDYSGHGNHGVNHGVDLNSGTFDGISAHIEVPGSASLKLGTGDFSLCAWIHTEKELDDVIGDVLNLYFTMATTVLYLHLDRTRFGYEEE